MSKRYQYDGKIGIIDEDTGQEVFRGNADNFWSFAEQLANEMNETEKLKASLKVAAKQRDALLAEIGRLTSALANRGEMSA